MVYDWNPSWCKSGFYGSQSLNETKQSSHLSLLTVQLALKISISFFYCILGFGVPVKNMQDSCIGTHVAVWFAAFLPITYIWHFSPCYLSPTPHPPPTVPPIFSPNRPQCVVLPSLCPGVLIVQHPPMSENMWCLIFCSWVSLLRMMVSRFIRVPTKDTNSLFLMAA